MIKVLVILPLLFIGASLFSQIDSTWDETDLTGTWTCTEDNNLIIEYSGNTFKTYYSKELIDSGYYQILDSCINDQNETYLSLLGFKQYLTEINKDEWSACEGFKRCCKDTFMLRNLDRALTDTYVRILY